MDLNKRANEMEVFFNKVVDIDYDELHMKKINGKLKILDYLPDNLENVVDLGCGTGLELIGFFKKYPNTNVIAIDVAEKMTDVLKERNLSDNLVIVNKSYFDYDFGISKYDAIISTQSLHHFSVEDKIILYTKLYKSLKDGGVFVNEDYFVNTNEEEEQKFSEYYNLARGEGKHYDTPLTVEHEIEILNKAGFQNIKSDINDEYKIIYATK